MQTVDWLAYISAGITRLLAEFRGRVETRGQSVTVRVIDDLAEQAVEAVNLSPPDTG